MATYFSDFFKLAPEVLEEYGAFDISIVNDLPAFIDPFLLFHSEKEEYQILHEGIVAYLKFLRDKAEEGHSDRGSLLQWYAFPEVKQNWLGYSVVGNSGSGLGIDFAEVLHANLNAIFANFGDEQITEGSHLEKVCLVADGIGRDSISDFTTNLIKDYLCLYTQQFGEQHLDAKDVRHVWVNKARFNYETGVWDRARYRLPWVNDDYVILTPRDILTKDETWINKTEMFERFNDLAPSIPNEQLRAQINQYFSSVLARPRDREPSKSERDAAAAQTIRKFPILLDYYIRFKEQTGDDATTISSDKLLEIERVFIHQLREFQNLLSSDSQFYRVKGDTYEEAHARLAYLKDVIENKGGHRIFYHDGKPVEREKDLQIMYRLVWFGSPSDVGAEANDGRGPVDYKISRGRRDKTLIEMKLAKNTHLERNLAKQVEIYQAASDAPRAIKVILFFSAEQEERAVTILTKLNLLNSRDVILIDARSDNKPSGSKA